MTVPMDMPAMIARAVRRIAAAIRQRPVPALVAVFAVASLPILSNPGTFRGDERFYSDAAIEMLCNGNYVVPVYPDGSARFHKPILTYWAAITGFRLFGVNLFAARLLSLVAGCCMIVLTARISQVLFGSRRAAVLAALLLFSNMQLLAASTRITPDVFLGVAFTLSFLGFARILFAGRRDAASYLLAYVGAGLAVASKGLLGLVLLPYAAGFCLLWPDSRMRLRDLVHVRAMLAGLVVALAWYIAVFALHGRQALDIFLNDQIKVEESASALRYVSSLFWYAGSAILLFLPWSVLAVAAARRRLLPPDADRRAWSGPLAFTWLWFGLVLAIFSSGTDVRARYLLPAYPLAAAALAFLFERAERDARFQAVLRGTLKVWCIVTGAVGVLLLLLLAGIDARVTIGSALLAATALAAFLAGRRAAPRRQIAWLAAQAFVLVWVVRLFCLPVFEASPAPALAQRLNAAPKPPGELVAVGLSGKQAGQLRLLLHGRVRLVQAAEPGDAKRAPASAALIVREDYLSALDLTGRTVEQCGYSHRRAKRDEVKQALTTFDRRQWEQSLRRPFYIAWPRQAQAGRRPIGDGALRLLAQTHYE